MADSALPAPVEAPAPLDLPEALQPPTKPVGVVFTVALTLATALFFFGGNASGLLVPLQILQLDPANKVTDLAVISAAASLVALIANPVIGAFSDRTTSRWGRRRPWIFISALGCGLALTLMLLSRSVWMLGLSTAAFQLVSTTLYAALAAIIPDQVPEKQRGRVSGSVGIANAAGSIAGAVLLGQVFKERTAGYLLLIAVMLVGLLGYTLYLREHVLPKEVVPPFGFGRFLKNFWINPLHHPDFGWAWLTRFLSILGYFIATGYIIYYLHDVLHYEQLFPGQTITQGASIVITVATVVLVIFTVLGGVLSDRFQRLKLFVIFSSIAMSCGMLVIALFPSWIGLLIGAGIVGGGLGSYAAVDVALVTRVLPSANDRAKDLGIINIANTLPQSLAPLFAAVVISLSRSYVLLFVVGAVISFISGLLIRRIKSVS